MFAHVGWSSGAAQALEVHRIYFSDLHCICSGSQCLCLPPPFLLLALKWHSSPFIPDNSWTSQLLLERSSGWMLWNLLMQTDPLKQLCGCLHLEKALASGESPSPRFWRAGVLPCILFLQGNYGGWLTTAVFSEIIPPPHQISDRSSLDFPWPAETDISGLSTRVHLSSILAELFSFWLISGSVKLRSAWTRNVM